MGAYGERQITPNMPARAYKTFQIASPESTHTRPATCEEVECQQYAKGWVMKIDLGTELGQKQAHYIKHQSGRSYIIRDQRDGLVTLEFHANQPCFQQHKVRLERPEIYRVKGGDYRGNPLKTPTRVHTKPEHWVEEFAANQEAIAEAHRRGSYE